MVLEEDLGESRHLTSIVIEENVKLWNVVWAFLALPLLNLLIMVAIIDSFLEITPILVLLSNSHLFEQIILLRIHMWNAPNQWQCFWHFLDFLVDIEIYFFLYVVHDLGHTLIVKILRTWHLKFICTWIFIIIKIGISSIMWRCILRSIEQVY